MTTLADLARDNPNIREQYDEWREIRSERGEDASDWAAFRQHLQALGAPDPGQDEPDDFVGEDFKAQHPERYGEQMGQEATEQETAAEASDPAAQEPE